MKIAIIGKMCSGKSTLCDKIINYYYINKNIIIQKRAFADKVYEIAHTLFNMKKKNRKLLQSIGSKMREINKNVWVNHTIENAPQNVIIEDCRYINELEELVNNKYIIIKINLPKNIQLIRLKNTYPDTWNEHIDNLNHHSETTIEKLNNKYINININYNYDFKKVINQIDLLLK